MDGMTIMTDLLKDFGSTIGTPDLSPDEEGYVCFAVDENLIIHLQYEQELETLRFFTGLGEVSAVNKAAVIEDLLNANVLWRGTGGATLGLDSQKDVVTMAYQEPISNISYGRFEQILEGFLTTAEQWMRRIQGEIGSEPERRDLEGLRGSIRV